ncbi:hypothetical protein CXB49_10945 [Chromobacterium sp. ATCC 53434]|nr:hypothetical protein CXB49_10945 [Chromobacterium sp. ATCC 53434]
MVRRPFGVTHPTGGFAGDGVFVVGASPLWGDAPYQITVATQEGLAEWIAEPDKLPVHTVELIKLAAACHLRLAERMGRMRA